MAKSHFSFKKRQKELARKLKQEQKRQRKLDKGSIDPEEAPGESQEDTALDASQDKAQNPQT